MIEIYLEPLTLPAIDPPERSACQACFWHLLSQIYLQRPDASTGVPLCAGLTLVWSTEDMCAQFFLPIDQTADRSIRHQGY